MSENSQETPILHSESPLEPGEKFNAIRQLINDQRPAALESLKNLKGKISDKDLELAALGVQKLLARRDIKSGTDSLTQVYNKEGYAKKEPVEASRMRRLGYSSTIALVDVNGVKETNDKFGHHEGDKIIMDTADVLKSITRITDIVARVGGDEFIVVLSGTNIEKAEKFNERLTLALQEKNSALSVSIGYANLDPEDTESSKKEADAKMYANKKGHYANSQRTPR